MEYPIKVNYEFTNNRFKALKWLNELPDLFAADFEVASKYTLQEKQKFAIELDTYSLSDEERRVLLQKYTSDGLSHPRFTVITHLSIAWSDRDSKVIICDNDSMRKLVTNFLVTTDKLQIWHNCIFDFKHINYLQHRIPSRFVDTRLLAKCIVNDANQFRSDVGLKTLMSYAYGDWAISKENFTLEDMWNPDMIRYAATDSPATYRLYQDIQEDLKKWKI